MAVPEAPPEVKMSYGARDDGDGERQADGGDGKGASPSDESEWGHGKSLPPITLDMALTSPYT